MIAQTAHHDMDIPIPLEAISGIEVRHGAGSTFYGSDAMGGAVNFATSPARATELRVRAGARETKDSTRSTSSHQSCFANDRKQSRQIATSPQVSSPIATIAVAPHPLRLDSSQLSDKLK